MAIAPVLKTGARKGLGVRIPHPPSATQTPPDAWHRAAFSHRRRSLLALHPRSRPQLGDARLHRRESGVVGREVIQRRSRNLAEHALNVRDTVGRAWVIREPCG